MIRAIYIVVEGDTEEEFVNSLVRPHFISAHSFYDVRAIKLRTSPGHKGGDVSFARYKHNVSLLLKREADVIVTEAPVFSARRGFDQLGLTMKQLTKIDEVIEQYPNPELINEGQQTTPSKRLERLIPGYQKVLYGNMIVLENGFSAILKKCLRFKVWIELLEEKIQRNG